MNEVESNVGAVNEKNARFQYLILFLIGLSLSLLGEGMPSIRGKSEHFFTGTDLKIVTKSSFVSNHAHEYFDGKIPVQVFGDTRITSWKIEGPVKLFQLVESSDEESTFEMLETGSFASKFKISFIAQPNRVFGVKVLVNGRLTNQCFHETNKNDDVDSKLKGLCTKIIRPHKYDSTDRTHSVISVSFVLSEKSFRSNKNDELTFVVIGTQDGVLIHSATFQMEKIEEVDDHGSSEDESAATDEDEDDESQMKNLDSLQEITVVEKSEQITEDSNSKKSTTSSCRSVSTASKIEKSMKTCQILNDEPVNSLTLHKFINCTKVEGAIEIRSDTFTIGTVYDSQSKFIGKTTPLTADDLEALSSVQEITDYLFVQSGKHLKSLSFLRNLRKVDGRRLNPQSTKNSVMITGSEGLEELGLVNLVNVSFNGVLIYKNYELCYADTLPWNSSIAPPNRGNVIDNRAKNQCEKEGKVCHPSCDPKTGCWGSGAGMCFQCQHYKLDSVCVDTCALDQGFFESSSKVCDQCHAECISCYGPYARNCTQCRHVRLNNECIKECPRDTHFVRNGICEKCHRNCYDFGCTGVGNFVGQNGCNKCKFAALHSNKTISHCLQIISAENLCSSIMKQENYYWGAVIPKLSAMVSDGVCAKCHENCRNCSGYGNDVENNQCSCVSHRVFQEQGNVLCQNTCPSNFYNNETLPMSGGVVDCFPCNVSCDGCFGPSANDCLQCKRHKVFQSNNKFFKCVQECPLDQPFSDASLVCSDVDKEKKLKEQIHRQQQTITAITAVLTVFIILVAACTISGIVAFICRRKAAKSSKLNPLGELFEMKADAKTDLSQLRLIVLDDELKIDDKHPLGKGVFGVVYKGIWHLPEDKPKIPVAVKVLHDATSTAQKEMLEEAEIMARINHKHLVRLIGVCLSQQMMLVTPLMPLGNLLDFVQTNKSKIGSAALLRWANQIADGMAHLESQRLVHRELAARNVLVQYPDHVRITDFGLAKMLDYGEEELKIFEEKMPIEWLALECIHHRRFTHKSDVWAFGVTLWELMTFGDKPYPDVPLEQIPDFLKNGDRLQQPKVCTSDVYMILINCWMVDCDSRPTFVDLRETFVKMLKDPGRYLSIEGDKLLHLPSHTKKDQCDLVRLFVGDPDVCNPDDYLDDPMTTSQPSTLTKPLLEHVGDVRSRGNQRNQSTSSPRYTSDPVKNWGGPSKSVLSTDRDYYSVPDSLKSTPSNQSGSVYTPIVTSSNGDKSHVYYNELPSSPTNTDPNDSTLSAVKVVQMESVV